MIRMQVFRKRFLIAASLFLVVLAFPAFVSPTSVTGDGVAPDCGRGRGSGIYIKGNEDFKGKYDFEGEGTLDDPFIIEGLQLTVRGYGIRIRGTTSYFIIRDCEFEGYNQGWGGTAIYFSRVENGVVENCAFTNMNRALVIHKSENIVIQENEFNSLMTGVRIKHSSSIQVSNNEIANNQWIGLYIAYSYDCIATENMIVNNKGLGVMLYDSGSCTLFGNYFEANEWGNAADVSGELTASDTNLWDDDVGLGNDWDDYEGTGVYLIPGDRGSVDRYPIGSSPIDTIAPVWNHAPEDKVIECGDPLNMMIAATDDSGIAYYSVNDTTNFVVDSTGTITFNRLLDPGKYPLEVRAYDPFENFCSASIIVELQDTICPEIDGPADVTYKEGETGNKLVWSVSDVLPSTYTIFVDDIEVDNGVWTEPSGTIEISIDGLSAGEYNYRLVVYDLGTNSASDDVTVKVEGKTPVPTTTPIPKPKTDAGANPPTDESMAGPYIEPVVVASGIGLPTVLGFAILFVIGKRREVA
jgi:parallel beta-helix repeat protein